MSTRIDPNSLAIDGNALSGLKRAAQNESPEAIKAAAKQFEAVLMNMMLKSMRDTVPQDGPLDNEQSKMFMGMLDQQLSTHLAQKGLGLADVLAKQLTKQQNGSTLANDVKANTSPAALNATLLPSVTERELAHQQQNAQVNTPVIGHSEDLAQLLTNLSAAKQQAKSVSSSAETPLGVNAFLTQLQSVRTSTLNATTHHPTPPETASTDPTTPSLSKQVSDAVNQGKREIAQKLVHAYQTLATYQAQFSAAEPMVFPALSPQQFSQAFVQSAGNLAAGAASHTQQFIQRMLPHAEAASAMSGIPAKFMVGQAALETGWGKHNINTADGQPSHNLFGIKADARWTGKVASSTTTEYIQGVKQTRVEKFRAYNSYAEAFQDYAKLISQQPRYQQAMQNTHDASAYAHALQRAGYATDPHYGQKLATLIGRMRT